MLGAGVANPLLTASSNPCWIIEFFRGVMSISGLPERRMGRAGHGGRSQP